MSNILNPYIAGAPVVETSMFFGREDIFGWIERSLTGKFVNHILVLHGQRRVGKTSVLKQIPHHLPKHYTQVFFDLQGRTNTTLERFLWWMASEISRTLKKECNLDLPKIERNAFADPEAFINDFLPSLRALIGEKILLLTFDEFDTLDRPDIQDSLARPLVAYLRRLMEIEGLNFIFSIGSSGNKLENMQASYTDFFKSALYRKVSFLTKDDCERLITKPVEGTISYEPAAVEKISYFTSGHPYFTQLMCHELFSRCQKTGSRSITAGDVDLILEDVIERGTVNLKFVWDEASDLEKWILAALAQEESASLKQVHQILKSQGLRTNESDLNSAILHLRDKDVLTGDNGFVIQLLKLWLLSNRPMDRVREELVQTNPITDRYIEIGDEYRERGENQQAIQSYEQALAVQENDIRALQNIAAIYLLQNSFEAAAKYFARILLIDEENIAAKQGFIQSQIYLAKKAIKAGDEVEAEKAIRSILMIAPSHVEATKLFSEMYVQKAETLFQNGLEDQAFEKFQQAIEISPDDEAIKTRYEKIIADKRAAQVLVWLEKAEKSLARQRWDEAASMVEEALNIDPENPDLQKRLLEIKDAPRQEKIKAYKQEAEQAIAKGNYPKAISAIQTAILLASEDSSLKQWLDSIQSDQANSQLRLYQSQADQAEVGGNWEAAIAAREAALKLDPQNERLAKALQSTKEAKQKQHINSLRLKIDRAKKEQNWEAALAAGEEYLQFSPEDQDIKNDLQNFRIEQRKSRLAGLKTQALSASKAEKWEDAIQHWQAYLAEKPEDGARVEKLIEQAKQKAALLKDYETAQLHIRKHQYNRAIHLLQGIIAKDPTYKASSRLLVEAVEANKQKKPIWRTPWIYVGGGVLLLAISVIFLLPSIKLWINPLEEPTEIAEIAETQISLVDSVFVPNPFGYALDRRVWYQISESGPNLALTKKPTFQDYFDEGNPQPYWQTLLNENHIYLVSDMFKIYDGAFYTNEFLFAKNFLIEFDYFTENGLENNITHIDINLGTEIYYRFSISNNGRYKERINNIESEWKWVPNWTSYKLENENTIKVKFIKNENEMTVFVNEVPLVYHKEFIENENLQIILNFEGDQDRSVIWLQSIRFWNLDEPDFLNSLIGNIENINPTFQDDFDIFSPQLYWEDLLAEQKIIVKNGLVMYANTQYVNENLRAKDFMFDFEYTPQNYDSNSYVNIVLSKERYYSFSLSNNGEFFEYINGNKNTGKVIHNWEEFLKNNDYVVKIRIIASNNTLAILVNDQTIVFQIDVYLGEEEVIPIINILSSNETEPVVILRNIKYWNLSAIESSDTILAYIENTPPTLENDFTDVDPDWLIGTKDGIVTSESFVIDGSLVVNNSNSNLNENDITFPRDPFVSKNSAISFSVDPSDFSLPAFFGMRIRWTDLDPAYIQIYFDPQENQMQINLGNTDLSIFPINMELTSPTHILIITYNQYLAVWADGEMISLNYIGEGQAGDFSHFFVEQKSAEMEIEGDYQIKFDDIHYWNLDEAEFEEYTQPVIQEDTSFSDPINTYINETPPTFEDDFSTAKEKWGNTSLGVPVSSYVQEGLVDHMQFSLDPSDSFPTNGLLDATDFAIQYYFDTNEEFNPDINFLFRSDSSNTNGFVISLKTNTWELKKSIDNSSIANGTYPGTYGARFLNLILKDNNLAIYLDRVLVYEGNDFDSDFSSNRFVNLDSENQAYGFIYSFKFWNLDGVEIGQEELEDQASQTNDDLPWMTDFVNPIMDYIENRSPDFEDSFDAPSNAWKLTADYIPYWNISFKEGEMIITGQAKNTLMTYFDYVAEVEIRRVRGIGRQGIGWDNGSASGCRFQVDYNQQVEISCDENLQTNTIISKNLNRKNYLLKFKLIVKNGFMAFYINDELLGHFENEQYRLYRSFPPTFSVGTSPDSEQDTNIAGIDNFRVWNISDLEIP